MSTFVEQCTTFVRQALAWTANPTFSGDAWQWASAGRKAGYDVSHTPRVGDAVVWQPGQLGADSRYGHVAEVTSVKPDGSVGIVQSNWPEGSGPSPATLLPNVAGQLDYIAPPGSTPSPAQSVASSGPTAAPAVFGVDNSSIAGAIASSIGAVLGVPQISSPVPWFRRNAVPLVTGVVIWGVLTKGNKGPSTVVNTTAAPSQPSEPAAAGPEPLPAAPEPAWLSAHRARGMVHAVGSAAPLALA